MAALKRLLLLGLVLAVLAAVLIALLPAKVAVDWVGGRVGPAELSEVSGSIWNGTAQRISVHGKELGRFSWQLHPLALLGTRLDADLQLEGSEYRGQGFASASGQTIRLQAMQIEFPAERLQAALDVPALQPHGRVAVQLDEAELVSGFPRSLKGSAVWREARVSGQAEALFGDLRAEFASAAGGIQGTLKDLGGPLQLEGHFEMGLTGFKAEADLRARDGNPQVLEALRWIGQPQPDGSSKLLIDGKILPVAR